MINLEKLVQEKCRAISQQKEEILAAFIAKYGLEPDEVELVEDRSIPFECRWYVRKRSEPRIIGRREYDK